MKELLLKLCRYPFDEKERVSLSKLIREVGDWHKLVELINAHGIIALAAYNIKEAGLEKVLPEDAMAILENGLMQSVVRNAWLTERWKEVNKILLEAGIKHVLLKGMALEHTVYGGRGLRQMTDNDILLKREDSLRAWYLLQKEGFSHELIKSSLYKNILPDIGKHLPTLTKNGYSVEIHHRLFDEADKNRALNDAIDNANEINITGTRAFVLQDDIHLSYLKEHFNRHLLSGDSQLRLYADMELLRKGSAPVMPDTFFLNPKDSVSLKHRKNAYRISYYSVPRKHRLRYLAGDVFPSLRWMKSRYGCGGLKAVIYYPMRVGKLMWLMKT